MRRPAGLAVPRAGTAVYQLPLRLVPGPRLHQAIHPQVQVEATHVAVQVAHLLLTRTPDLLDVLIRLFQGTAVGHRLQDLLRRRLGVGTRTGSAASPACARPAWPTRCAACRRSAAVSPSR